MPYIKQHRRLEFNNHIEALVLEAKGMGELNYIITRLCDGYISKFADYGACNAIVGVLECAKLEFARRRLYPLEEGKCKENGEVFE